MSGTIELDDDDREERLERAGERQDEAGDRQEAVEADARPCAFCGQIHGQDCAPIDDECDDIDFPDSRLTPPLEIKTFRYALNRYVLAVATTRIEGTWSAYVGVVAGENHGDEMDGVLRNGTKLPVELAVVMFPYYPYSDLPYAH